jgi:hypothetical protein
MVSFFTGGTKGGFFNSPFAALRVVQNDKHGGMNLQLTRLRKNPLSVVLSVYTNSER